MLRPIQGFSGYSVSQDGRVWSDKRNKWLKPRKSNCGYLTVGLTAHGKTYRKYIHRLVAAAWIQNPNNLPQVNHIDEDKTNNSVDNLEWCSARYNSNYGTRNSRICKPVVNLTTGERFESTCAAAKSVGISESLISEVCSHNPRRKTASGCMWAYMREGDQWPSQC